MSFEIRVAGIKKKIEARQRVVGRIESNRDLQRDFKRIAQGKWCNTVCALE